MSCWTHPWYSCWVLLGVVGLQWLVGYYFIPIQLAKKGSITVYAGLTIFFSLYIQTFYLFFGLNFIIRIYWEHLTGSTIVTRIHIRKNSRWGKQFFFVVDYPWTFLSLPCTLSMLWVKIILPFVQTHSCRNITIS